MTLVLMSREYQRLNALLHSRDPDYGTSSRRWAPTVRDMVNVRGFSSILDYGAGKGMLASMLPDLGIRSYDPAVPGIDQEPEPAELVICTDVLEHVEPDYLPAVLEHVRMLGTRAIFCAVSTRVGRRKLPDGRPAHINVRPAEWWAATLERAWGEPTPMRESHPGEYVALFVR